MAGSLDSAHNTPQSYEQIGRRIQRMVAAPGVQKVQAITVARREDEPFESWERVLQEIEQTEGIEIERHDDGSVRIGWRRYIDS